MRGIENRESKAAKLIVAVAIVGAAGMWLLLRGIDEKNISRATPSLVRVRTITARTQHVPDELWASGTVRPIQEATISPKIMGEVTEVLVKEGDRVRKGQVLLTIEARDLAAQAASAAAASAAARSMADKARTAMALQRAQTNAAIANAEAALKVAKEQMALLIEGPRKQEKSQARLAVMQAEAQFKNAETELARMKRLYEQGVVPKQRLEGAQTQYDVAKAQYGIAQEQAEVMEEGTRSQEIRAARERVRQAEASLRLAKAAAVQDQMARREAQAAAAMAVQALAGARAAYVQVGYATLTAPFSGVVTARHVDPGEIVSPGMPVVTIEDDSLFRLEAAVPVGDAVFIRKGSGVCVELGKSKRRGNGVVSVVTPASDPTSRKFIVKVDLPRSLSPMTGDFGRAGFAVGYTRAIIVPKSAVHDNRGILTVFVVGRNNRADMRLVRTGHEIGTGVEIITGLMPGDRVITWSARPLEDDTPVSLERS
jgi:RND family efflux transporter MFP subunit